VLNPGGVRIGTAEIYRQVAATGGGWSSHRHRQTWPPGEIGDVRVVLFVKLREGLALDEALSARIKARIRRTPRRATFPRKCCTVPDIPRTKSNKIVELCGAQRGARPPVKNVEALANPEAARAFQEPTRARLSAVGKKRSRQAGGD